MSDEGWKRVDNLEREVEVVKTAMSELNVTLSKVVTLIQRIQWIGTGIGLYFMLDNLGFLEALKVAMKVL